MWKQLKRKPLGLLGAGIIGVVIFTAIFANWLAPYDPYKIDLKTRLKPPSWQHLFGTDKLGRDILSRVIYGTRISLQISSIVVVLAFPIGTIIGAFAGFTGSLADEIIMRITDVFLSIPGLVLAMAIAAALGPSIQNVILALAVVWWTWYARLSRSSVLQVKEFEYVEAAKAIGNSNMRLIFRHIFCPIVSRR
jgi:peptide/nickel transport system permease protein